MIRIILADDHPVVCAGILKILETTRIFRLVDQVCSGDELLHRLSTEEAQYDLVMLEITLPGMNVFDVIREIRMIYPGLPVVVFTMVPQKSYAIRCFKLGASAFMMKDSQPEEIIQVLKTVAGGKNHFTSHQVDLMADSIRTTLDLQVGRLEKLTERELQVLHLLATGLLKGEIAHRLAISKHTISNHRGNILRKLNLRNNAELTRYAIQNGLIR